MRINSFPGDITDTSATEKPLLYSTVATLQTEQLHHSYTFETLRCAKHILDQMEPNDSSIRSQQKYLCSQKFVGLD